ncbi:MAG: SGNH/GDSL hydrolase family protein [Candidatus Omnitrophica bacterium]|nr:SGNH/GDSL hydrolase family protein [Candidatus Omnitrophota bacterium]
MRKNLLLLTISILFSLILMELALRLIQPPSKIKIGSLKAEKSQIYGWALYPNDKVGFIDPDTLKISYQMTNSQGWKDIEHNFKKPKNTIRILFLGDSITYGVVAKIEDIYARYVEYLLKKREYNVEVIALALGGWGTDQALEALETEGFKYKPDFIIYQFCENDVFDNLMPDKNTSNDDFHNKKTFKYEIADNNLRKIKLYPKTKNIEMTKAFLLKSYLIYNVNRFKNIAIDYFRTKIDEERRLHRDLYHRIKNIGLINPLTTCYRHDSVEQTPKLKIGWQLLEALVLRMKSVSEAHKAKFLIFCESGDEARKEWELNAKRIQTDGNLDFVIFNGIKYPVDLKRPLKNLQIICKKNNIPLIEPKRKYYRYNKDAHPDKTGNANIGKDIVEFLLNWEPFLEKAELNKLEKTYIPEEQID